ncbi:hypothetical protein ACTUHY_04560, partial [Acidaminococcus sp. LBK-2]|uniref:hypothetical protein n=1 Tax=Acidaminococcus sp. LBK-2 TaxID=3456956 RepID=UPI003FA47963
IPFSDFTAFDGEIKIKTDVSKNRSRPCVVDELELTPTFDKEPKKRTDACFLQPSPLCHSA